MCCDEFIAEAQRYHPTPLIQHVDEKNLYFQHAHISSVSAGKCYLRLIGGSIGHTSKQK